MATFLLKTKSEAARSITTKKMTALEKISIQVKAEMFSGHGWSLQGSRRQDSRLRSSRLHPSPPEMIGLVTLLTPPPQSLLHVPVVLHSPHSQSNETVSCQPSLERGRILHGYTIHSLTFSNGNVKSVIVYPPITNSNLPKELVYEARNFKE